MSVLLAGGLVVSFVGEKMRRTRIHERRQMHELADLTQLTNLGQLLIRDDQDRILLWSDGCARLYGFTAEQAVGRVSQELLQTEFSQPLEAIRATLHQTGRWEGEQTQHRADGSIVHVASSWVLRNGTAHPVVLEVNNDITDRKRAEEALREARDGLEVRVQERTAKLREAEAATRESEERLQFALKANHTGDVGPRPGGSHRLSARSNTTASSATSNCFRSGLTRCSSSMCCRRTVRWWTPSFARPPRPASDWSFECRIRRVDGEVRWIWATGRHRTDAAGQTRRMAGIVEDITERKRTEAELAQHRAHLEELVQERTRQLATVNQELREREQALRDSEERYHRFFEDDVAGDFISTPDGRVLLCNSAFAEVFGFSSAQEAVGTSILDLYPDPGERGPLLERLRQEGKIDRLAVWRKRRDGEPVHIVENLVGHFNDQGELYEIKGYLSEDTERQRAEEALGERMKELACLYAVSRDMQKDSSLDELCRRAVGHLVSAMQYPELTVVVIELNDKRFTSGNYAAGLSHGLQAQIRVEDEVLGHLTVYYAQERPFIIPEEQNLVNGVAEALSTWLERQRAAEASARERRVRTAGDGDQLSTAS